MLAAVGLQPSAATNDHRGYATASRRGAEGVILAKLSAGSQAVSRLQHLADDMPLVLMPVEDGVVLEAGGGHQIVSAAHLLLLPRRGDWSVTFQRDMRVIVLSITSEAFHGRIAERTRLRRSQGNAARRLHRCLHAHARGDGAVARDVIRCRMVCRRPKSCRSAANFYASSQARDRFSGTATQAAILYRVYQTIERKLGDPGLASAKVADAEGISERYLQKLFEGTGSSFTHYIRERRLQRTWADLSNPDEAHHSISEIAYRSGFNDAAYFSRAFRNRFGLSPREFRQHAVERASASSSVAGQRGWPQEALAQLRNHYAAVSDRQIAGAAEKDQPPPSAEGNRNHHHLSVEAARVHWGYFSRSLQPQVEVCSGDTITIETLTQHASDDPELMIVGDAGAESVFHWTRDRKNVDRRGAGPVDASVYGRGAGEGFGVHICTGPVAVKDAQPGDVLEVRILDIVPRPSKNRDVAGRVFGSSVAAWWGYHYNEFLDDSKPREVVTIYEICDHDETPHARALYSYRWEPQTDPFGVLHSTYDYPGVPVVPGTVKRQHAVLDGIRIPLRPHFGVIAVAPREAECVDSVPPSYFGGILTTGDLERDRLSICRSRCPALCCQSAIRTRRRGMVN